MFTDSNRNPFKDEKTFISMLTDMALDEIELFPQQAANFNITTSEFTLQTQQALIDIFNAEICEEENYVLKLNFANDQKFKIRIIKE